MADKFIPDDSKTYVSSQFANLFNNYLATYFPRDKVEVGQINNQSLYKFYSKTELNVLVSKELNLHPLSIGSKMIAYSEGIVVGNSVSYSLIKQKSHSYFSKTVDFIQALERVRLKEADFYRQFTSEFTSGNNSGNDLETELEKEKMQEKNSYSPEAKQLLDFISSYSEFSFDSKIQH